MSSYQKLRTPMNCSTRRFVQELFSPGYEYYCHPVCTALSYEYSNTAVSYGRQTEKPRDVLEQLCNGSTAALLYRIWCDCSDTIQDSFAKYYLFWGTS